jgi:phage terminase small subunit
MKSKNLAQAAIAAGYSPKYAAQSAHQALQGIRLGVPEILNKPGYSVPVLIENI